MSNDVYLWDVVIMRTVISASVLFSLHSQADFFYNVMLVLIRGTKIVFEY